MNCNKSRDVFKSYLNENFEYSGFLELPIIQTSDKIPNKLVSFSRAMSKSWKDFDCWVHFYEHDEKFERIWSNPKHYLNKLKKFKGVISPDFSLYRNMPLVMQMWNTYRGRALAAWLNSNGVSVIPNVRFNDMRTYLFCFDGIEPHKTIALGTHGCIKGKNDKEFFKKGLAETVSRLNPQNIIVYGATPDNIFKPFKDMGINIISFESEFSKSRRKSLID